MERREPPCWNANVSGVSERQQMLQENKEKTLNGTRRAY
jgi:hypothetical protein